MSPRAAGRLESLGFTEVYDYVAGKVDWFAAELPTEGTNAERPRAADVAARDVPTCRLDERLGRVLSVGWDACVVVNDKRTVLELLRAAELDGDPGASIAHVMRPGPSTFRPFVGIEEMAKFMADHDLVSSPVTASDGKLVGLLHREDAVRVAGELHAREARDG
ncbi:MAG: CBS domain-containing protein [bacterium]